MKTQESDDSMSSVMSSQIGVSDADKVTRKIKFYREKIEIIEHNV